MKTPEEIRAYCKKKGYSTEYTEYWCAHPFCEVVGCNEPSSPPHHIRTRGAGGGDEPGNLLSLCTTHHTEVGTMGVMSFADKYSHFFEKIIVALSERDAINIFVGRGW